MVVVMLAAEDPSADGPLASTPRRGMDCVDKASAATKKLVQARLPFKRLNPEPKESRDKKRTRTAPSAPQTPESIALDRENKEDEPSLPLQRRPALVNGRGPLDCFMSRRKRTPVSSSSSVMIDLTEDSNSTDAVRQQPSAPVDASCPITGSAAPSIQDAVQEQIPETAPAVPQSPEEEEENMETDEAEDSVTLPQMDLTMESETEQEEQQEGEVSQNESLQSPVSASSVSLESSPEPSKSTPVTPASVPRTDAEQKKVKRRSLKSAQEMEEKQRQREEKERMKEEARAAKEKKREAARKLKEEKEKEKKEKKEKDEKERREKKERDDKEKAEKQRAKEEQRKVKIEAKLEEKRKKEEEKRLREEKDQIKAEKAAITRFLQKSKTQLAPKTLASVCGKFAPFEIKEHMIMAPLTRVQCDDSVLEELDQYLAEPGAALDGLKDWLSHKPRKSGPTKLRRTKTMSSENSECVVVTDDVKPDAVPDRKRYGRMKLLQFHENYRPAYWGTCSKKSTHISPRCPLRQDKDLLDYEVDSDDEWEEEEPGESLSHSEGDDDDEAGEDDDDDDGFFVPHGYLSDGEGALEDEEGGDLEKQKVRQKLKAREWDELIAKKKLKVLEAVVKGCIWEGDEPSLEFLRPFAVCMLAPLPREEPSTPEDDALRQQKKEQLLSLLLPLLHGNVNSSKVIISEFQEFCRQQKASPSGSPQNSDNIPPRIHVKRLMKENAVYEKRSTYRRCCWYVHAEVLARFGQEALSVPCKWTYLTPGAHVTRDEPTGQLPGSQNTSPSAPQSSSTTPSNRRKSASNHSITKYMKKCTDPEQTDAMETDGFQADTEDDEDDDCVILCEQTGSPEQDGQTPTTEAKTTEPVDISDTALSLPCPTPATA